MCRKFLFVPALLLVLALAFQAIPPASAEPVLEAERVQVEASSNGIYIIQMIEEPVVAYRGGIEGLPATRPQAGRKIDPNSANVQKYAAFLRGRHDEALAKVGGRKLYNYVHSFNGFAARLNREQAERMVTVKGVLRVSPDELVTMDTSSTPSFLELDAPGGLWDQLGGVGRGGEDIIIGIVDSGIWPESLSFADRVDASGAPSASGKRAYRQVPGWHGKCSPGEAFNASMCNQKLIGAQHYNAAFGGDAALEAERPWEFMSPRDYDGHGTHTASTAGGNYNTPTTGPAAALGSTSGMAPRARIAAYKVLWANDPEASQAGGRTSDIVAAIDQAVADGVDVINYSISGTRTNFLDPVQVAFLFAADAGVFVAASAGNSGPGSSTVAHPGPWLTTVAAGTHNRNGEGSVTLGDGSTYFGASLASAVGPAPLIDSVDAGLPGANPNDVALCFAAVDTADGMPVLDPAKVAGKIVVCDRGITARVNKSLAVQEAGGVGMILLNPPPSAASLNADFHFVPTVHLQFTDYAAVHAYAATTDPTATIHEAEVVLNTAAPFTASFSSRGPLLASGGNLLKPDVMAPGVDVLASVAPPGNQGLDFNLYSGTSMSSPHVAGLAALLKELRPGWSPMAIKSALMTTGYDVLDGGTPAPNTNPVLIFRQGAGHVEPNTAAVPGLVYDHGFLDWLAFLCGTTTGVNPATCSSLAGAGFSFHPSDLNVASIALGSMPGAQTVTRTVTNVGDSMATYQATLSGLAGFDVSITPDSLTLAPGESASYEVAITNVSAPLNTYRGGQLSWNDGLHDVRIPIVVRPVALGAPPAVFGTGEPISYEVTFGYTGAFSATPRGLIPADVTADTVDQDPDQTFDPNDPTGTVAIPIVIPAGTTYARFALFDADVTPGTDLDLFIYDGDTLVGASTTATSTEEVNFTFPTPTAAPAQRIAYVHGWGIAGGTSSPFKLHFWGLGTADEGNMAVSAPASAVTGATGTIELNFSGLAAGTKYLGSVAYGGIAGLPAPTIVRVDIPE